MKLEILTGPFTVRLERTDMEATYFADRTLVSFNVRKGLMTRKQALSACAEIAIIVTGKTECLPIRKIGSNEPY